MYLEKDLGVYARGVAPFSYPYDVVPFVSLRCRSLLPTQDSNTPIHGDASTGKQRHLFPQAHRRKIFFHFHMLSHPSTVNTIKRPDLDTVESTEPNYQQSSTTICPVKEVDTELLQTDTRELSEELSDLADDLSSIHGDIYNLLPEHSIISIKKCSRRKRKMAEATAANQQDTSKSVYQNRRPKHKLLLWTLARKRHRLIHAYLSLDSKDHNFIKKDRAQSLVLHKLYRSTCE
nr:hypothetical transcript [Hymenolepis microstoma]